MNEIGLALLFCMCQITLLSLLAGLLYLIVKPFGPVAGVLVTSSTLLVVLMLSAFALSPWPSWQNLGLLSQAEEVASEETTSEEPFAPQEEPVTENGDTLTEHTVSESSLPEVSILQSAQAFWESFQKELLTASTVPEAKSTWQWTEILLVMFSLAMTLGLSRLILGWFTVRQFARRGCLIEEKSLSELVDLLRAEIGCRREVQLRESPALVTAATLGWRHPLILLPREWKDWSEQELRAVLAHELAHIQGNDFLSNLFAQVSLSLHFYHPLVHWLVGRMRLEQELVADAQAARLAGGSKKYLTTLAELALKQTDRPLGWPARTFLPTRRNFLRRIEMLRDSQKLPLSFSRPARVLTVSVVIAAGLLVAGLRGPGANKQQTALAAEPGKSSPSSATKQEKFSLKYVPNENVVFVFSARPSEFFQDEKMKPLAQVFNSEIKKVMNLGIPLEEIEELTYLTYFHPSGQSSMRLILRSRKDIDPTKFRPDGAASFEKKKLGNHVYYQNSHPRSSEVIYLPNSKTFVRESSFTQLKLLLDSLATKQSPASWKKRWNSLPDAEIKIAINFRDAVTKLGYTPPEAKRDTTLLTLLGPVIEESQIIVAGASLSQAISINAIAGYSTNQKAADSKETLLALKTLAKNMIATTRRQIAQAPGDNAQVAAMLMTISTANELLSNLHIEQKQTELHLASKSNFNAAVELGILAPALQATRSDARSTQSKNNLKQIALATHNYHDVYGSLPPAVSYRGPGQKIPVSWRVLLLPLLGYEPLFKQYRMSEPWDSPHNRKLLTKMPDVYRHPSEHPNSTNTSYFVLTGEHTMFPLKGKDSYGISFQNVKDGTSNTISIVEAKREIPWTKPEDIPYDDSKPLPKLGGYQENFFLAAFVDGSVHRIRQDIDEKILRPFITRAGQELTDIDKLHFNN